MVAHGMELRQRPPPAESIQPTGLKIWPDSEQDVSATAEGSSSKDGKTLSWREKQRRVTIGKDGETVHSIGTVFFGLAGVWSLLLVLFLLWWRPHVGLTGGATGAGMLLGVLLSWIYFHNVKHKEQYQQVLSMDPGLKGCQYLLGKLPNWIALTEREKMEWLNRLLIEVWPFYDRGVCDTVKSVVEPIMEMYRPPLIMKRIFFQELTFGEAPVRIEGISVRDVEGEIDMEVDVRWVGDANISLGIDLPIGGDFTRLCPKVKDIVFVATLKIILRPLVEEIPGFAAAAVALKSPPIIKYRLDFGSLPSTVTTVVTSPIVAFVDLIINMIVGWFTWPRRMTVPILGWNGWVFPGENPVIDLEVERLAGRQQGVIRVHVIQAKDLKSYDTLTGKSDPFVEVFTTADQRSKTRVISNNLAPVWDEKLYLPVLEKDTVLRIEMFDHDAVNITSLKEMTALQAGKEFMGRTAVPLKRFISEEGLEDEIWLPLGKGDWTNLEGPGHGEGLIMLGLQYRAVENIAGEEIRMAQRGLLLVGVIRCFNLGGPKTNSYATVKVVAGEKKDKNKDVRTTPTIKTNPNPRWDNGNKFTLPDVTPKDMLVVTLMSPALGLDDELGTVEVPITKVIGSTQVSRWTQREQAGYMMADFPLRANKGPPGGRVQLELEFLPYW